jgi:Beta-xylosidase
MPYFTLRVQAEASWLSLTERPGYLRLRGRESLYSLFEQSMVARRLQHFVCDYTGECVSVSYGCHYAYSALREPIQNLTVAIRA